MDLTSQLLGLIKDSLGFFRILVVLMLSLGFLKTALSLWLNYKIKKLEHKSTYQVVFDGNNNHRAISLTTAEKIEFEKLERHLLNNQILLADKNDKDKKSAA
ncbi:MAG: hypothetical protein HUU57_10330 [Bdellovibrio sp.]|nr:hypothetical protein [Bdellovibrio sp.]